MSALTEIEPGLRAVRPVQRLTQSDNRCIIAYYLQSPLPPDGSELLYFEFDQPEVDRRHLEPMCGWVTVAQPDGSEPRRLDAITVPSPSSGAQQQWCGDLPRVAYFLVGPDGRICWRIIDVDTGQRWDGDGSMRHISPDGRRLSIQNPNPYSVGEPPAHESAVAVLRDYENERELFRVSVEQMLRVHPDGESMRDLHLGIKKPLFSPTGEYVSFVLSNNPYRQSLAGGPAEPAHHELYLADADGSNLRYVAPFVTHPSWHPDGRHYCALVKRPGSGALAFALYPADGSEPVYWEHASLRAGHPSLQPHGRYMVNDQFDRDRGVAQLWLYDTVDWHAELLVEADYLDYSNHSGTHLHPAWRPDGRSIFFNSAHPGPSQVYRIDMPD